MKEQINMKSAKKNFLETVRQNKEVRFVMKLPKNESQEKLADTKRIAPRLLIRAKKNLRAEVRLEYSKSMKEY